jgi:hypothetical protein
MRRRALLPRLLVGRPEVDVQPDACVDHVVGQGREARIARDFCTACATVVVTVKVSGGDTAAASVLMVIGIGPINGNCRGRRLALRGAGASEAMRTGAFTRTVLIAVMSVAGAGGPAMAQGQFRATFSGRQAEDRSAPSRVAEDRSVGSPAPAPSRPAQPQPHAESQRQAEPIRQAGPVRQPAPAQQRDPQRQDTWHQGASRPSNWQQPAQGQPAGSFQRAIDPSIPSIVHRPGENAFRAAPGTYYKNDGGRLRHDGDHRRPYVNPYPGYLYVVPYAYPPYYSYADATSPAVEPAPPQPGDDDIPLGYLRLRVEPRSAEVWVDGEYAGMVDDFGGTTQRLLQAGPHRVEIIAPGFDGITVDVRIPVNDTITFSRDLERVSLRPEAPAASAPAIPHKAMYIVPRCYVGDTPPRPGDLPTGCNLADLRVIP